MVRKFGLIGKNIGASGSPALFKAAYGGKFPYDLLDGERFAPLFEKFRKEYCAVNVTAPFKKDAFDAADVKSEAAQLCSSANMLIKMPDGRILADNSDFEGVTLSILSAYAVSGVDVEDEDGFDDFLSGRTALIAGCGGAGCAAAAAAVTMGYGRTVLMNRDITKALTLKQHLCSFYGDVTEDEMEVVPIEKFTEAFKEADTVIYTIPEAVCDCQTLPSDKKKLVFEANYKTPCLGSGKPECNYIGGLNWLYNQAVVSYEAFTGMEPDEEAMKQQLNSLPLCH